MRAATTPQFFELAYDESGVDERDHARSCDVHREEAAHRRVLSMACRETETLVGDANHGFDRVDDELPQFADVELAIDEKAEDERVDGGLPRPHPPPPIPTCRRR